MEDLQGKQVLITGATRYWSPDGAGAGGKRCPARSGAAGAGTREVEQARKGADTGLWLARQPLETLETTATTSTVNPKPLMMKMRNGSGAGVWQ